MANSLFGSMSTFTNPMLAWDALHRKVVSDNQSHMFMLTNQLHTRKMSKGGSMEKYIDKVTNLKNKLLLGKAILDKSICQLVFNAYEEVMRALFKL